MKRADITAGQDYLKSGSPDWENGHYTNTRVRIIDAGKWEDPRYGRSHKPVTIGGVEYTTAARQSAYGTNVLAIAVNDAGEPIQRTDGTLVAVGVSLATIRSEWEPAAQIMRERAAQRRVWAENSEREAKARRERQDALQAEVEAVLGHPLTSWGDIRVVHGEQTFSAKVVRELLALVQA